MLTVTAGGGARKTVSGINDDLGTAALPILITCSMSYLYRFQRQITRVPSVSPAPGMSHHYTLLCPADSNRK